MGMVTAAESAGMMAAFTKPGAKFEYRVATENDLSWVIARYVEAADRCVRAGFDGVEIHAGHGYLIDEFLSPGNTRDDGWGGTLDGRARLLVEVIRAIRKRVGRDFPVWIRINALEPHKADGERWDDQLQVIDLAVDAGIDAVHVTAYADDATGPTDSYAPHVVGPLADYAAAAKARVVGAGDHLRPLRARRGRPRDRRRQGRLRLDGAQAARRPRPAEQARRGARRRRPPVHLPVPVHRQHLRERTAALRRQRGNGS